MDIVDSVAERGRSFVGRNRGITGNSHMENIEVRMNQLLQDYRATLGGRLEDYFGAAYIEAQHRVAAETALDQTTRGNNDYGLDGYAFDQSTGNLYLYQFKYSSDWRQFQGSMRRMIKDGLAKIFALTPMDVAENPILQGLRSELDEFKPAVRSVYIRFVFTGNPTNAEDSDTLSDLKEQIEDRQYLLKDFFDRDVAVRVQFLSTTLKSKPKVPPPAASFTINLGGDIVAPGPDGETMHTGFVSLADLLAMYRQMNTRLFDRNIRAPLAKRDASKTTSVNQKIADTLRRIVIERTQPAAAFAFMHNGVTIYAQRLVGSKGSYEVTEPRVLNGAQTVATTAQFAERFAEDPRFKANSSALADTRVLCKIVAKADDEFVRAVTVATNRQNPVHPANLRANDPIQLQIADWLRENGFFYERQENSAAWQDPDDLAEQGVTADRVIQIKRLGETFAVTDGKLERARNMNELFDSDLQYAETFHEGRLVEDLGKTVLCYKCRTYCHNTLAKELTTGKTAFVDRAKLMLWALVCQGLLNQSDLGDLVATFGTDLRMPSDFRERLLKIAMRQVKPTFAWLVQQKDFAEHFKQERYDFLRGEKAFKKCMSHALEAYGWRQTRLGRPVREPGTVRREPSNSLPQ
jgi:hypothetical protein